MVERYNCEHGDDFPTSDGAYVQHSDYATLSAENAELRRQRSTFEGLWHMARKTSDGLARQLDETEDRANTLQARVTELEGANARLRDIVLQMQGALAGIIRLIDIIAENETDNPSSKNGHIIPTGPTVEAARKLSIVIIDAALRTGGSDDAA